MISETDAGEVVFSVELVGVGEPELKLVAKTWPIDGSDGATVELVYKEGT
jgi:hypothetical protein